jgi:hypothetical protein
MIKHLIEVNLQNWTHKRLWVKEGLPMEPLSIRTKRWFWRVKKYGWEEVRPKVWRFIPHRFVNMIPESDWMEQCKRCNCVRI